MYIKLLDLNQSKAKQKLYILFPMEKNSSGGIQSAYCLQGKGSTNRAIKAAQLAGLNPRQYKARATSLT